SRRWRRGRLGLLHGRRRRRRWCGGLGLLRRRFIVAVAVALAAPAAFATVVILALGFGRPTLLRLRRGLLRRWLGASITAAAILTASTAAFAIAFFAALTAFFVVVWGGRFCPRGLCNLKGFTGKRLPVGHRREGDGTEGGE
ncbi:MAG: hypothetical protein Q8K85_04705, partial [Hyphomicrobium sp.]|nr:hypothetical protein [Hyphomicrobium sp.]